MTRCRWTARLQVTSASELESLTPRIPGCEPLFWIRATLGPAGGGSGASSAPAPALTLSMRPEATARPGCALPLRVTLDDHSAPTVMATVLGCPRPNENKEPLKDYGDAAAAWLSAALPDVPGGVRLTGIGSGAGYRRMVVTNPKQGDVCQVSSAPVSLADEAPYLLTTEASLGNLNARLAGRGQPAVDMRRFRPNIVVAAGSVLQPWEEDSWKRIRIGAAQFWVWQRCGRCTMTTIDRDTLRRGGPEPLATLGTFRERAHGSRNFGVHLVPCDGWGGMPEIAVGARVEVLEHDAERRAEWLASR